jgi:leader peptidase (prepilin peptidase)/N-methyltransferase
MLVPVSLLLAVLAVAVLGPDARTLPAICLGAVTPELIRIDLREHRLPNHMVVPGLVVGLIAAGLQWSWVPLAGALGFGGFLLILAVTGGIGMGDVKLATLIGLASPTLAVAVAASLLSFLLGGFAALVVLALRGRGSRIPFGPALLAGYWIAVMLAGSAERWHVLFPAV